MSRHLHEKRYFKDIFVEIDKPAPLPGCKMWWSKEAEGRKTCKWFERKRDVPGDLRHAPELFWTTGGEPVAAGEPPMQMCINRAAVFSSQARAGQPMRCQAVLFNNSTP